MIVADLSKMIGNSASTATEPTTVPTAPFTLVNAGFTRKLGKRSARQTVNVQNIAVPLPADMLCDKTFRAAVRRHAPTGDGWLLEGYCLAGRSAKGQA